MKYQLKQSQEIYCGRILKVIKAELTHTSGKSFWRETVIHPEAVAIIPEIMQDQIILIKQFRYPTGKYLWEIPAGTIDGNETPLECARRELAEETGYQARFWKKLAMFYTCPGFCTEKMHLFLARKLSPASNRLTPDKDEEIVSQVFTRQKIRQLIDQHKIIDAKTLIGLMLWLQL